MRHSRQDRFLIYILTWSTLFIPPVSCAAVFAVDIGHTDERWGVHFYDDLAVLKNLKIPGVLFEAGIIVNRAEEEFMRNPATRKEMAGAVADALELCIK